MASESAPTQAIDQTRTADVVIVGMGPVGKMAALLLAQRGHTVVITDRRAQPYPLPRAVAHDAEIARIFQNAGLPPTSMPDAVEPYDDMYDLFNGQGQMIGQVDWRGIDPSGWNNTYFYNQPSLERHLDAAVRALPSVTVHRAVEARVVDQDDDGVSVRLTPQDSEASPVIVRARYVLAADGAGSLTREDLGVGWIDRGFFYNWLVVDVLPDSSLEVTRRVTQLCNPSRPTTLVPAGPGRRRWEFMRLEGETNEELARPERVWELLAPFGVTPQNAEVERGVVYTFKSCFADRWKQGRVFLLGDAAHLTPPFAGQGLCAGLRDCENLAWKLDLVLRGAANPDILDSYASERSDHVRDFIDFAMELGRMICVLDPEEARRRDEEMVAEMASGREAEPPPAPRLGGGLHEGDTGGYLSWQGQVTTADILEPTRFDDIFGPSAIIVDDPGLLAELTADAVGALERLGTTTAARVEDARGGTANVFVDANGTYRAWFETLGARAVLVRPDFYVFGTASDASGVARLADRYLAALSLAK